MGGMTLEEALYRLTHHRSYREAFVAGRDDELGLDDDDLRELESVDVDQLQHYAERVIDDVLRRKHRGTGGLRETFPRTLSAWRESHPADVGLRELIARFLESDAYGAHRDVDDTGCSREEAFFHFCAGEDIGTPAVRREELLSACLRGLVICPRPSFRVPDGVHRRGRAWVAIGGDPGEPVLFVASPERFVRGAVTPFIAAVVLHERALDDDDALAALADEHRVTSVTAAQVCKELAALGLGASD